MAPVFFQMWKMKEFMFKPAIYKTCCWKNIDKSTKGYEWWDILAITFRRWRIYSNKLANKTKSKQYPRYTYSTMKELSKAQVSVERFFFFSNDVYVVFFKDWITMLKMQDWTLYLNLFYIIFYKIMMILRIFSYLRQL